MRKLERTCCLAAFFFFGSGILWADAITILPGNHPQPNEEKIDFNQPGLLNSGTEVQGLTTNSGFMVDFTGTESMLTVTPSSLNSGVMSADGAFTELTMSLNQPGATFGDYIFDINTEGNASGAVTLAVELLSGATLSETLPLGPGANFFTILASPGNRMVGVNFLSTVPMDEISHNRLSDLAGPTAPTPEPASLFLIGTGLVALAAGMRRRRGK